jgi:spore coat polysaccharide biosynthesis protein SpsF
MQKPIIIIQARNGSSRFPYKMVKQLGNYPILEWVIRRVLRTRMVGSIVLATSDNQRDSQLEKIAEACRIKVFRGDELDVLGRFKSAVDLYGGDPIIRVCADNPFIDPIEIDRLILHYHTHLCEYAFNHLDKLGGGYSDGFGAEVFSVECLNRMVVHAQDSRFREHLTSHIWENPHLYRISPVKAPIELAYPELRFDVDTVEDLKEMQILVDAGVCLDSTATDIVQIKRQLKDLRRQ